MYTYISTSLHHIHLIIYSITVPLSHNQHPTIKRERERERFSWSRNRDPISSPIHGSKPGGPRPKLLSPLIVARRPNNLHQKRLQNASLGLIWVEAIDTGRRSAQESPGVPVEAAPERTRVGRRRTKARASRRRRRRRRQWRRWFW